MATATIHTIRKLGVIQLDSGMMTMKELQKRFGMEIIDLKGSSFDGSHDD
jgi:hypothetical protein